MTVEVSQQLIILCGKNQCFLDITPTSRNQGKGKILNKLCTLQLILNVGKSSGRSSRSHLSRFLQSYEKY